MLSDSADKSGFFQAALHDLIHRDQRRIAQREKTGVGPFTIANMIRGEVISGSTAPKT